MRNWWMLAATLLISSCAMVNTTSLGATLILKPQIQAGAYSTKTVVNPYTQASINHLILKLYTFDGTEHDQGIQKSIPNAQLTNSITFSNLRANTAYRIKAYAYFTADESHPISTNDANCYTDITLANDDHPTVAALKVKLIDISFNGQGTGSLQVTNGGYNYIASEGIEAPYIVSTLAGGGGGTAKGNTDGVGTAAKFYSPEGIAVDAAGNLYVADRDNHLIRKITSAGVVTTLAGQAGTSGYQDGAGTSAKFTSPWNVAVDAAGNVYVADSGNQLIRKITSGGVVTTLAGQQGVSGYADGVGTAAKFSAPRGISLDGSGNLYIADRLNNLVRKVTSGGVVTTFAGGAGGTAAGYADGVGTAAMFNGAYGGIVDQAGNLYVADRINCVIRKITSAGVVSTLAGAGTAGYVDGIGTAAMFNCPEGVAVDALGNVYVADSSNHVIRRITPAGVVSTLAGQAGTSGYVDGTGLTTKFNTPIGIAVDDKGNIFVGDYGNYLMRVLK